MIEFFFGIQGKLKVHQMAQLQTSGSNTTADLSFEAEEVAALRAAMWGRFASLTLIGILATVLTPWPRPIYIYGLLAVFIFLGYLSYIAARAPWRRAWHSYAFVTADFALLSFTLIYPNPLIPFDLPPQMGLRFGNFIYFFVLLSGLTYLYKPGLVLWGGLSAAVSWFIGIIWLQSLPGSVWREPEDRDPQEFLALFSNPEFIDLGVGSRR